MGLSSPNWYKAAQVRTRPVMKKTTVDEPPFTESVPALGKRLLGLGRQASYEAARTGVIPTIKVGRKLRGLTRVMEERLTRDPQGAA
jgi:hypothetical protein